MKGVNRRSVVTELARVLQTNEEEAERILRAFAQVLGPVTAEVPPYFERYFESQIRMVIQRIDELEKHTERRFQEMGAHNEQRFQEIERRFAEIERRFAEIERRFERLEWWLFSFMVVLLASILAAVFKLYFGG